MQHFPKIFIIHDPKTCIPDSTLFRKLILLFSIILETYLTSSIARNMHLRSNQQFRLVHLRGYLNAAVSHVCLHTRIWINLIRDKDGSCWNTYRILFACSPIFVAGCYWQSINRFSAVDRWSPRHHKSCKSTSCRKRQYGSR